jgi:hypothetical protein
MTDEETRARAILAPYAATISATPALLSLLYDADMLPEQIITVRGAISVAAVVEAYNAGLQAKEHPND